MVRKIGISALVMCLMVNVVACGSQETETRTQNSSTTTVEDILENGGPDTSETVDSAANADETETEIEPEEETVERPAPNSGVDYDLTQLTSTMVYSEVYNMMMNPEQYIGKSVRTSGIVSLYHSDKTEKDYYSIIIADATACCSQGLEFETMDGVYPTEGEEHLITGTFETYEEDGMTYCRLAQTYVEH